MTLLFLLCAVAAFGQNHPLPKSDKETPAICTGCEGINFVGQANDGLPTWSYPTSVLPKFVGRILDSSDTQDYWDGMRTARAERMKVVKSARGTAPPRIYMRLGSTLAAYTLDTFFSTRLPGGTAPVSSVNTGGAYGNHKPLEKILVPDAFVYPEATRSGWTTAVTDGQDRLGEWDVDDRGYVYIGYSAFGWGIVKDSGETGGKQLPLVKQVFPTYTDPTSGDLKKITPWMAFSIKSGGKYYAIVSDQYQARQALAARAVYDVTDPTNPVLKGAKPGSEFGLMAFAKDDANARLAVINGNRDLLIYDYADFVAGKSYMQKFDAGSKPYVSVTADDDGNFWALQGDKMDPSNVVTKIAQSGSGYRRDPFDVFGQSFAGDSIEYSDKYLTIGGRVQVAGSSKNSNDVFVFHVSNTSLDPVDTKGFFQKYYHAAPAGYAQPHRPCPVRDAIVMKNGSKTYIIYFADSMADVYELQGGDSITANITSTTSFGTKNPNSEGGAGPYYGDILKFKSISSNPAWDYNVEWNFGNPEAGSDNTKLSKTGNEVTYQYTGLNTAAKITAQKTVTVANTSDDSMADSVKVNLQLPAPRVGVQGNASILVTQNNESFDVVAGDKFIDASDGVIEGHYGVWNIGTATTSIRPNETVDVGVVGTHTLNFVGRYGRYDNTSLTSAGTPYEASLTGIDYTVRPFDIFLDTPTKNATSVTFKGASRISTVAGMFTAQNWTVTWTLKNGAIDLVPPQVDTVAKGTIPNFVVPVAVTIPSGTIVTLKVEVLPSEVDAASQYAVDTDEMTLSTPDPQVTTNCTNTGSPCSLTVSSKTNASITDWTYAWVVKSGSTTVKTGTSNPLSLTLSTPGTYNATVLVTKGIFSEEVPKSFTVTGPVCGRPPTAEEVAISTSCSTCSANQEITFKADLWAYDDQPCNEYKWTFGDGGSATGRTVKHTYTSNKTYTVTLTIKTSNGEQTGPISQSVKVGSGTTPPPDPGGDCTKPTGLVIAYSGKNGCAVGTACGTSESVKFNLYRGNGTDLLQDCDTLSWNFDDGSAASTAKAPSHTFTQAGTYDVVVTVTNSKGTGTATARVIVSGSTPGGGNCPSLSGKTVYFDFKGAQSNCAVSSGSCTAGEEVQFNARGWQFDFASCDKFEWDFDDGSALVTQRDPKHTFAGNKSTYNVKLRVWNDSTPNGVSSAYAVPVGGGAPVKQVPTLTFGTSFPKTGAKDREITFTVTSNVDLTTGWKWTFNNVADNSQTSVISKTNSIKHTFTQTGTFTVKVTARNAEDVATAPTGSVQDTITITDEPEAVYLLPVVAHIGGQNNSSWRTDLQIYNPDPNSSESNPLIMSASFNGQEKNLYVLTSTYIRPDFMSFFTNGNASGPVIMRTKSKYPPQIWTRTYNQTENGTYGQFIPAIRIDSNGGGSATLDGNYYLAGLRQDNDFRTNLGFVNPTSAPITATITVLDDHRVVLGQLSQTIGGYQLVQFPISQVPGVASAIGPMSVVVEIPAGQWIIAYASLIDAKSSDPVFIQAVRETELSSADYQNNVIPGVGHVSQGDGSWRSDVTIFNPSSFGVQLTLEYYNSGGTKLAEGSLTLDALKFIQYSDLLKQGVLGNVPDGLGMLRVKVANATLDNRYPMTFARTYFDRGNIGTYGQGIGGFSAARPNVQPGKKALIPGVRDNSEYYTNIGLMNIGDTPATVVVTLLDPNTGAASGKRGEYTLQPNQSVVGRFEMAPFEAGTLIVETNAGKVWAFASCIDRRTKDPEYVPAIPLQ